MRKQTTQRKEEECRLDFWCVVKVYWAAGFCVLDSTKTPKIIIVLISKATHTHTLPQLNLKTQKNPNEHIRKSLFQHTFETNIGHLKSLFSNCTYIMLNMSNLTFHCILTEKDWNNLTLNGRVSFNTPILCSTPVFRSYLISSLGLSKRSKCERWLARQKKSTKSKDSCKNESPPAA